MKHLLASAALAALIFPAAPAFAQDAITLTTAQSEEYGTYLADADGRAVYLFTADTQGSGNTSAQVSCQGECLQAWPPLYTQGEPQAGDQVDSAMLGTVDHDGQMMVTYNGWPLYYFTRDEGADTPSGQHVESFGGEWYLVSPEGEKVEGE